MSYLRPSCSDAAARVTNLSISRFIPTLQQVDAPTNEAANSQSHTHSNEHDVSQRLPSRRPLDRRWDQSRGLVFSQRSNVLKNHTWTSRRGIVFASNVGQRRGYAMRVIGPATPKPQSSTERSSKIYGSTLPDLERAPEPTNPTVSTASKGSKQERFERDIRERNETIEYLRKKLKKTEAEISELQRKIAKFDGLVAKFDAEKDSIYSKGEKDGNAAGRTEQVRIDEVKFKELASEIERLRTENDSLNRRLLTYKEDFMTEVREKEKELAEFQVNLDRRDGVGYEKVEKKQAEVDEAYAKANQWYDEVKAKAKIIDQELKERNADLNVREQKLRTRKNQRLDYNTYRNHYRFVHDERKTLDEKLRTIQKQIAREREELQTIWMKAKGEGSNSATSDQEQEESTGKKLKALENMDRQIERVRSSLSNADADLKKDGHASRLNTRMTRFGDTSLAADVTTAILYSSSINPLRSAKFRTSDEIREVEAQIKAASNATLREELEQQKGVLMNVWSSLFSATDLAYLDSEIQVMETLKLEPYTHKAAHMRTADLREGIAKASKDLNDGRTVGLTVAKLQRLRDNLDRQAVFEKRRAQVFEIMGLHKQDEKELDRAIDAEIMELVDKLHAKMASMSGYQRAARAGAKRVPARARSTSVPSTAARSVSARTGVSAYVSSDEERAEYTAMIRERNDLKTLLSDTKSSFDPSTRNDKLDQFNGLSVKIADAAIAMSVDKQSAALRSGVKNTDREYTMRERGIARLKSDRDRYKKMLADKYDPAVAGPKVESKQLSDLEEKHRNLQLQLEQLDPTTHAQAVQDLNRQSAAMRLEINNVTLQSNRRKLAELGPKTAHNARKYAGLERQIKTREIMQRRGIRTIPVTKATTEESTGLTRRQRVISKRKARSPSVKRLSLSYNEADLDESATWPGDDSAAPIAAEMETRSSESEAAGSGGSAFRRLDMSPSSPKEAAHVFHARRKLHDSLLWPSSEREQLPLHETVLPKGIVPRASSEHLSAHGATLTDGQQDGLQSGFSDKGAARDNIAEMGTEAARDDSNATSHVQAAPASLSSETSTCSTSGNNNIDRSPEHSITMAETEEEAILKYEIPLADKRNALIASRNSTVSFWKYSLYKNAAGESPTRHYCTTFEQTEAQIANFLGEKVVGFDLEWEKFKSKPGEDSAKRAVSLMQVASEGRVALFHLALFRGGDSVEDLLPPSLRAFLDNPEIVKVGVNIGGDATRLRNCFGVQMQGNIELSHLYKVVTYGESQPEKVNRGLYSLANQVKEVLHLPLAKDGVRTSSWSKRLNVQQIEYAASDAYAGLRLYYELERRRKAMKPKPPRPAFHELALPIMLGGGQVAPSALRKSKQPAEAVEEPTEEPNEEAAALQEPNDGEDAAEESSDDFFDTAEDLEALDAYVESQDAAAGASASASLPEITYPTLPPLESISNTTFTNSQSSIDLPSDPLAPPPTTTFHSPQAATADAWATTWQSQLPQAYNLRVSQPHLRAYHLWHHQGYSLQETAELLRKQPLALSTVVSYVAEVLQKEELEFDEERVKEVRARLPASVRSRYGRLYAKGGE